MNKIPILSVIIPVFNRQSTIKSAIDSVLQQKYRNIEIIVVDDGSTDNSREIIQNISDLRIRYIYQKNMGACAARNNGIKHARGKFIAFHDSDDIWHADKLDKQLPVLLNNDSDIVFSKLNIIKEGGKAKIYPAYFKEGIISPIKTLLGIGTQTLIMRSDIAKENLFDVNMPRFQELEFLIRATRGNRLYCIDKALVDYRIGKDSISRNENKLIMAIKLILEKHSNISLEYPIMAKQFSEMLCGVAKKYNNLEAQKILKLAQKYNDSSLIRIKILLSKLKLFHLLSQLKK